MNQQAGILYHDIDLEKVSTARRALDVSGHYSRPDIFQLHVNTQAQAPVVFDD
jgi:nitrilase